MPIYDFQCPKCGTIHRDVMCKVGDTIACVRGLGTDRDDKCEGVQMERILTAPRKSGIQFTGVKGSSSMRTKS